MTDVLVFMQEKDQKYIFPCLVSHSFLLADYLWILTTHHLSHDLHHPTLKSSWPNLAVFTGQACSAVPSELDCEAYSQSGARNVPHQSLHASRDVRAPRRLQRRQKLLDENHSADSEQVRVNSQLLNPAPQCPSQIYISDQSTPNASSASLCFSLLQLSFKRGFPSDWNWGQSFATQTQRFVFQLGNMVYFPRLICICRQTTFALLSFLISLSLSPFSWYPAEGSWGSGAVTGACDALLWFGRGHWRSDCYRSHKLQEYIQSRNSLGSSGGAAAEWSHRWG